MRGGPCPADAGVGPPSLRLSLEWLALPHFFAAVVATLWLASSPAASNPATRPLETAAASPASRLIAQAREQGLARDPVWRALLHYASDRTGLRRSSPRSEVENPAFFLSASGSTDPTAELIETIRGLLAPLPADPDQHARCRYPARANWLIDRLPPLKLARDTKGSRPAAEKMQARDKSRMAIAMRVNEYPAGPGLHRSPCVYKECHRAGFTP